MRQVLLVNLLPWRERRQARRLWQLGCLAVASVLVLSTMFVSVYSIEAYHSSVQRVARQHYQVMNNALAQQIRGWQEQLRQTSAREAALQRQLLHRKACAVWWARIAFLAQHLPSQAWLTHLTGEANGSWSASGLASGTAIPDTLDSVFRRVAAPQFVHLNELRYAGENWHFSYQSGEQANDEPDF